jgi:hypothetical protein
MANHLAPRLTLVVSVLLVGCGASVGDPCDEGDECGAGLVCFTPDGGEPACAEPPAACDGQEDDLCGCEELIAQCEMSYACVGFGDVTTLACGE